MNEVCSPGDGNGAVPGPEVPEPSFGERLKYLRSRRGMTREVLGGLAGKSAEWVKAVENGRLQQPKLHMLLRLARRCESGSYPS